MQKVPANGLYVTINGPGFPTNSPGLPTKALCSWQMAAGSGSQGYLLRSHQMVPNSRQMAARSQHMARCFEQTAVGSHSTI